MDCAPEEDSQTKRHTFSFFVPGDLDHLWPLTLTFELGRDFCRLHLTTKFHHRAKKQTNSQTKQMLLKTSSAMLRRWVQQYMNLMTHAYIHHYCYTALFFWDHPSEPVPEENFWTLWCNGRLTEADTPTIRLGTTPSGLSNAHLHRPPYFL